MTIPQNLKELRKLSGMTQEEVAAQVGLTRQAISSYESGRTEPDLSMLSRLAQLYGTDLSGVLYGRSRDQRRLRAVRRTAAVLCGVALGLLLLRSVLLLALNCFFPIPAGAEGELLSAMLPYRFTALQAAALLGGLAQTAAWIGAVVLAVLLWDCPRLPSLPRCGILLLASAAAALAATLPFAALDPLYRAADYCLVLINALLPLLLLFLYRLILSLRRAPAA